MEEFSSFAIKDSATIFQTRLNVHLRPRKCQSAELAAIVFVVGIQHTIRKGNTVRTETSYDFVSRRWHRETAWSAIFAIAP